MATDPVLRMLGLARRAGKLAYGDELVRSLFDTWEGDIRQAMLDDLTWLYLESAAYALELPRRPVLSALRRAHADYFFGIQYKLSRQEWRQQP